MKTSGIFKRTLLILVILGVSQSYAQRKGSFENTYDIPQNREVHLNCQRGDVTVELSTENTIRLKGTYTLKSIDDDDFTTLQQAIENVKVTEDDGRLLLNCKFYEKYTSVNGRERISLGAFNVIKARGLEIRYTLYLPADLALGIKSKYNKIHIPKMEGKVMLDIYNGELTLAGAGKKSSIKMKYSDADIGEVESASINLYDSDMELDKAVSLQLKTKYSDLQLGEVGMLQLDSYDDKLKVEKLQSLESKGKYTEYQIMSNIEKAALDVYDCTIETMNVKLLFVKGKYNKLSSGSIAHARLEQSFDNDYRFGPLGKIECSSSKYDKLEIEQLQKSANFEDSYDSDFEINAIGKDFKGFSGNFKYGKIDMDLSQLPAYCLKANMTYGHLEVDKSTFTENLRYIDHNDKIEFSGCTAEGATAKINITCHDTTVDLD